MKLLLFLLVALVPRVLAAQPPGVTTLDGQAIDPLRPEPGVVATALIFLTTDCPIANQSAPEIERVFQDNLRRGVRVWLVFVEPSESPSKVREHLREFGLHAPVLRDPARVLVRQSGVHVTPEAVVYVQNGAARLTYRGRIDDRAVKLGRQRPQPTTRDLQKAIDDALSGEIREPVVIPAVGCRISKGDGSAGTEVPAYE